MFRFFHAQGINIIIQRRSDILPEHFSNVFRRKMKPLRKRISVNIFRIMFSDIINYLICDPFFCFFLPFLLCQIKYLKLATTSSTGGLLLALQRAIVTARPKGRYRKHFCWPAIKRYYSNLLVSILLLALLYTFELLHLLYCQSFQHNIL